jgi:FSR family fosmidomycin resistance protein-like MFS transporter
MACFLGLLHLLVDASSLALLNQEWVLQRRDDDQIVQLIIVYNCLAFGLQLFLGLLADWWDCHRLWGAWGLGLTALSVVVSPAHPEAAMVGVALGNGLFHTGAGGIVLKQSGGGASRPGLFVGPGALGVALGIHWGLAEFPGRELLAVLLLGLAALLSFVPLRVSVTTARIASSPSPHMAVSLMCVLALASSVSLRSLVGESLADIGREEGMTIALLVAGAAAAGKMLGGVVADRVGWRLVAVGSQLLLAGLLISVSLRGSAAVVDMFLLQLAMPVTLAALLAALPRLPGTVFGLGSLALLLGALPSFAGPTNWDPILRLIPFTLVAASTIFLGLSFLPPLASRDRKGAEGSEE